MSEKRKIGRTFWPSIPAKMAVRTVPALLLAVSFVPGLAQSVETPAVKLPDQIEYKGLPGALQVATLFGDPAKPEVYVQRIKIPTGLKLMPHYHPDSPRTVAVLSGTLHYALGEVWDEGKLKAFPAGTFFTEAPRAAHFAWAKDGEVVLQLTSIGPSGTTLLKAPQ
jgi:quercetin dioxygenase-like cupin family protein